MPKKYTEYKLRIHGKVNGEDMTPLTLPMSRLAQYLSDFATIMGHREHVHFREVAPGSAMPVVWVEIEKDQQVRERIRLAGTKVGPTDAQRAYAELNARLIEDDGYGEILETIGGRDSKIIEFPGKRTELSTVFGPIKESAFVQGELKRVGGQEPTIPVHLEDADGKMYCCSANKDIARALGPYLFQQVRLNGIATWLRDEHATWQLENFEVQSYTLLTDTTSAAGVLAQLRAVPENEWNKFDDPLKELRRIRHGEDEIQ